MQRLVFIFVIILSLSSSTGCEEGYGPVKRSWGEMKGLDDLVGNMNDTSYSNVRSMEPRLNALNKGVKIQEFEGQFVWAEYVSPFCDAARKQTLETKNVRVDINTEVAFLTMITSNSRGYKDPATASTARRWSNQFHLDPEKVLAAPGLWAKTVPEHRLFSPEGHTLFVHVGYLTSTQIMDTIFYYKTDWEEWSETGKVAEWMTSL